MKEPTYKSPAELLFRVRFATHQIEAARKQAIAGYDEDLRMLRDLDAKLATPQMAAEPELFSVGQMVSPDVDDILRAPLAKYER